MRRIEKSIRYYHVLAKRKISDTMKRLKIGPRVLKTAAASALSMFFVELFNLEVAGLAIVASIITLQPTVYETVLTSKRRIFGTVVGSLMGLLFAFYLPYNVWMMFLGVAVILYVFNYLKWNDTSALSAVIFASIFAMNDIMTWTLGLKRLLCTLIGVMSSVLINYLFPAFPVASHTYGILNELVYLNMKLLLNGLYEFLGMEENRLEPDEAKKIEESILSKFDQAYRYKEISKKEEKYIQYDIEAWQMEEDYKNIWNMNAFIIQVVDDIKNVPLGCDFYCAALREKIYELTQIFSSAINVPFKSRIWFPAGTFTKAFDDIRALYHIIDEKQAAAGGIELEDTAYYLGLVGSLHKITEMLKKFEEGNEYGGTNV